MYPASYERSFSMSDDSYAYREHHNRVDMVFPQTFKSCQTSVNATCRGNKYGWNNALVLHPDFNEVEGGILFFPCPSVRPCVNGFVSALYR